MKKISYCFLFILYAVNCIAQKELGVGTPVPTWQLITLSITAKPALKFLTSEVNFYYSISGRRGVRLV
jgi:hypothetical protein